jgi:hypothetical protein
MPVYMGIMCEVCRKVYFVATSRAIKPSRTVENTYVLACPPPCREVRSFRKETLRPYRASDEAFQRGYAEEGKYELV